MRLGRRQVLLAILAPAAAGPAGFISGPSLWSDEQALARRLVEAMFSDRVSARAIGAAYLATLQAQSPENLVRAILSDHAFDWRPGQAVPDLEERTRAWVRSDFARSTMVHVEGWMLSRTEARLCALAALVHNGIL